MAKLARDPGVVTCQNGLAASLTALLILSSLATSSAEAGGVRRADESVGRFFKAVQDNDERLYGSVAPEIVLMAAPDFGVPMPLAGAREAFAKCTVLAVSPEEPMAEMRGFKFATAKLSCPTDGLGALDVAFVARRGKLLAAYPGGFPPPRSGGNQRPAPRG